MAARIAGSLLSVLCVLLVVGCDQARQASSEPAEQDRDHAEEAVVDLQAAISEAASLVGATARDVTPEGNWVAIDAENPPFFYEIEEERDTTGPVKIRTKVLGSFTPNVPHPTTIIGRATVDCPQATVTYGRFSVEYLKSGAFGSYLKDDEDTPAEVVPYDDLASRHRELFDQVCATGR